MAKKAKSVYMCAECGNEFPSWQGQCSYCGAWNSIVEQKVKPDADSDARRRTTSKATPSKLKSVGTGNYTRITSGISELDRVLGGGIVLGSMILISGPNVGKSSLTNALLGQDRVIVSDVAGTTRDSIDTYWTHGDQKFVLIDTAGMRRKSKIEEAVERYSIVRSLRSVDRSDIVVLVLDAQDGVTEQDKKIAGYAYEAGKGVIIVVNKWDLVEKDDKTTLRFTEDIYDELGFLQFAPILFASALTKQRIHRLADMLKFVSEQQYRRVSTGTLNQLLQDAQTVNPVPSRNGRIPKIYYMTQASVKPPTFILFVNEPELIHFSYMRFLENRLRESFGFEGTPIRLVLRGKKRDDED